MPALMEFLVFIGHEHPESGAGNLRSAFGLLKLIVYFYWIDSEKSLDTRHKTHPRSFAS